MVVIQMDHLDIQVIIHITVILVIMEIQEVIIVHMDLINQVEIIHKTTPEVITLEEATTEVIKVITPEEANT